MRARALLIALALLARSAAVGGEHDSLPDFSSLSLQELSAVKVTSVSKKPQKLLQVAAAVYVISQEDIRRSGMTNVADVLRMAPGLSVARLDGNHWAVTSRGFNGQFADKLLVLVDGRSIYSTLFSGVYWDMIMPLLDDIERIEVIRGPGASVWGANAVAGVVNIITKTSGETQGTTVSLSGGSFERAGASARYGGRLSDRLTYRAYANFEDHGSFQTASGQSARDFGDSVRGGFRMDKLAANGGWMLGGDFFDTRIGGSTTLPTVQNGFANGVRSSTLVGWAGNLNFEWRRRISETSDLKLNASTDFDNRPDVDFRHAGANTGGVEIQYHFKAARIHDVSIGVASRFVSEGVTGAASVPFNPSHLQYQTASAFAQDEVRLFGDRLLLTGGLKIERDVLSGWQAQPTGRILWAPNQKHSFWAAASRAARTPTFYERTAQLDVAAIAPSAATFGLPIVSSVSGSSHIQTETSNTYETGYRAQLSPQLSVDLTGFLSRYPHLRSVSPGNLQFVGGAIPYILLPYNLTSFDRGHVEGGELAATYHPVSRVKLGVSYGYLNVRHGVAGGAPSGTFTGSENASPSHQVKAQVYTNLTKSLQLDSQIFFANRFQSPVYLSGNQVIPSHVRADLRLGWRVNPRLELDLVGQDLFSGRRLEITAEADNPSAWTTRAWYLKTTWRY